MIKYKKTRLKITMVTIIILGIKKNENRGKIAEWNN